MQRFVKENNASGYFQRKISQPKFLAEAISHGQKIDFSKKNQQPALTFPHLYMEHSSSEKNFKGKMNIVAFLLKFPVRRPSMITMVVK